jgi:hypothetical protein
MTIALDCAHGATYQVAPKVFAELGATVHAIGAQPDGLNINRGVGSMHPEAIVEHVRATGADLGIAFDGDGDRVLMVDGTRPPARRRRAGLAAGARLARRGRLRGPVVGTLMTNYALEQRLADEGIEFLRAKVGDRFVHQALVERGGVLGGEASGHLLCLDRASTGDAIVAALQVLEALPAGRPPARRRAGGLPAAAAEDGERADRRRRHAARVRRGRRRAGTRRGRAGRARPPGAAPSGTEPVVRVTVEAGDAGLMQQVLDELSAAVQAAGLRPDRPGAAATITSRRITQSRTRPESRERHGRTHPHPRHPPLRHRPRRLRRRTRRRLPRVGLLRGQPPRHHRRGDRGPYSVFKEFFALPDAVKRKYHVPGSGGARGYTPFGIETRRIPSTRTSRSSTTSVARSRTTRRTAT